MGDTHGLTLVLGVRETRKTLLLQYLVERHRQRGHQFLVRDVMGHWLRRPGVFVCDDEDPEAVAIAAIAHTWKTGHGVTIVMDECWDAFDVRRPPKPGTALHSILRTGRQPKWRGSWRRPAPVAILAASQRPNDLDASLRALVNRIYLGHMSAGPDLDWVEGVLRSRELAERLPALELGKWDVYDVN